jgi:hypothetical protein
MSSTICGVLNKITATKFDVLAPQVTSALVNGESSVPVFAKMVFVSSKKNPSLNSVFARLVATVAGSLQIQQVESLLTSVETFSNEIENPKFAAELYKANVLSEGAVEHLLSTWTQEPEEKNLKACCEFVDSCKEDLKTRQKTLFQTVMAKLNDLQGKTSNLLKFQILQLNEGCKTVPLPTPFLQQSPKERTIYVSHIDCAASEGSFMRLLCSCGTVSKVRLCGNTTQSTQYAFVEFQDIEGAQKLLLLEGKKFGVYPLHCSISRNVIHDRDSNDAKFSAQGMTKACTFGIEEDTLGWKETPLRKHSTTSRPKEDTNPQMLLDSPDPLPLLLSVSNPLTLLVPLLEIGSSQRTEEVAHLCWRWCFECSLLTTWVNRAFHIVIGQTRNPLGLMKLGNLLVQNRTLSSI